MMQNNKGFSLLEVIIAITLLSFMMLAVVQIIGNSTNTKERVTKEDQELFQVESALQRMKFDITEFYTPLYFAKEKGQIAVDPSAASYDPSAGTASEIPFVPSTRFPKISLNGRLIPLVDTPDKNTFIFFSSSYRRKVEDSLESNYSWIKYTLKTSTPSQYATPGMPSRGGNYDLIRYSLPRDPYAKEFDWDNAQASILLQNVSSLEFQFYDERKEQYVDGVKTLPNPNLIRGVKVKLVWVNGQNKEQEYIRYFRTIWPYFDTDRDEAEKKTQPSPTTQPPPSG